MRILITGSTGMVGKGVLLECLDDPKVSSVVVVNRSPLGMSHDKMEEIIVKDFFSLDEVGSGFKDIDACCFCLGITSFRMSEADYSRITYDLTLNFAKELIAKSPNAKFFYVSGAGTDSTAKGRTMWARVKGRTENDLLAMPFAESVMFRPGYIQPMRGIRSKTALYQTAYNIFKPLYAILKHFPSSATNTTNLGKAMIEVAENKAPKNILENSDINALAKIRS